MTEFGSLLISAKIMCICRMLVCAVLRVSQFLCVRSQDLHLHTHTRTQTQLYAHSPITSTHTLLFSHQVCSLYFKSVVSIFKYLSSFLLCKIIFLSYFVHLTILLLCWMRDWSASCIIFLCMRAWMKSHTMDRAITVKYLWETKKTNPSECVSAR